MTDFDPATDADPLRSRHLQGQSRMMGGVTTTLMWEVRAVPGRVDELVAYVQAQADPSAQVYRSAGREPRVVVIDPTGRGLPDVPDELLARPPHAWPFERVR